MILSSYGCAPEPVPARDSELAETRRAGTLRRMFEAGLFTLAKIVAALIIPMGMIPIMFLLAPGGDRKEPSDSDVFDTD